MVEGEITVSSINVPAALVAKTAGKITHLLVNDGEKVVANQTLGVIENSALFEDVVYLDSILSGFSYENERTISEITDMKPLILGSLQSDFLIFQKNCRDYQTFIALSLLEKKIQSLEKQKNTTDEYYKRIMIQNELQAEDLEIAKSEYRRDSIMHVQRVLSPAEFDKSKAMYISRRQSFEQSKTSLTNIKLQKLQLEQTIIENQLGLKDQSRQYRQSIDQSLSVLQNSINNWKQTFLLVTPVSGIVTFTSFREINQNVSVGDVVLTVVPEGEQELLGSIVLPMQGAGKVKVGQKVSIRFYNYPYLEFGIVEAKIRRISLVPKESNYILEVEFPNGLTTNYHKELTFSQEMKGSAEIITEDLRLIERLLAPIRAVMKERM